jgi:sugar transferase (PEP-CTERM/EpsH1 system associated)
VNRPLVAHIIYRLDFGGLENGLVNLINHMPADRYQHAVLCLAGFSDFRKRIKVSDVEVVSLNKKPGKDIGCYMRLWRELRRLRPNIVHTRNLGTVDMQWIATIAGVRHRVHGEHGWEASDPRGRNRNSLRIRRACRPVVQRYVAVSKDISRWLQEDVQANPGKVQQIYNGVDDTRFDTAIAKPSDFPWGQESIILGTVGRLDPIKNQLHLLETFKALRAAGQPWSSQLRLVIVGDGPLRQALQQAVEGAGLQDYVWLPGARNDVPELMRAMDIFVLPSLNEGISNTILEAMAAGKPVVAAEVGGNPELIQHAVTGELYASNDARGLERALGALLCDPARAKAQGEAGRRRAQQQFGLPTMVGHYLSLYDELLCAA